MKRLRLAALLAVLIFALALPSAGFADFGNFAGDMDFGGDFGDFGGGFDTDWDTDWDTSSSGNTVVLPIIGGSGGGSSYFVWIVVVIVLLVVFGALKRKKGANGKNGGRRNVAPGATPTQAGALKPISALIEQDPGFSPEAMTEKLGNLYVAMQEAWQAKDIGAMRAHLTDAMFNQFERQVNEYRLNQQTNYIEHISVLGVSLSGWAQDEVNDKLVARLQTRIVDYVKDDTTGKVVRGSTTKELFMDYEWTLVRTRGKKTQAADGPSQLNCNSCGAPVDINHTAKCEYCGAIITASDYDWVISSIKGISQRSS